MPGNLKPPYLRITFKARLDVHTCEPRWSRDKLASESGPWELGPLVWPTSSTVSALLCLNDPEGIRKPNTVGTWAPAYSERKWAFFLFP